MSEQKNSDLQNFLKMHQPKAPPPPLNELEQIKAKSKVQGHEDKSTKTPSFINLSPRFSFGFSALAACLIAVWFFNGQITNPNKTIENPVVAISENELRAQVENSVENKVDIPMHGTIAANSSPNADLGKNQESEPEQPDIDVLVEEWPTMDIGEDYLVWASL